MFGAGVPAALVQEKARADGEDPMVDTEAAPHLSSARAAFLCRFPGNHSWQLPLPYSHGSCPQHLHFCMQGAHSPDHAGAGTSMATWWSRKHRHCCNTPRMHHHMEFLRAGVPAAVIMQEQAEADDDDLIVATEGTATAAAGARGRGGAPGEQGALVRNILEVEQALQVSALCRSSVQPQALQVSASC